MLVWHAAERCSFPSVVPALGEAQPRLLDIPDSRGAYEQMMPSKPQEVLFRLLLQDDHCNMATAAVIVE